MPANCLQEIAAHNLGKLTINQAGLAAGNRTYLSHDPETNEHAFTPETRMRLWLDKRAALTSRPLERVSDDYAVCNFRDLAITAHGG